jgi:hypothetical protein
MNCVLMCCVAQIRRRPDASATEVDIVLENSVTLSPLLAFRSCARVDK